MERHIAIQSNLDIREMQLQAIRTNAMAEFGLGMLMDVSIQLFPKSIIITNVLAIRANGHKSAKGLDL
jgi:hypothetical protein